MENNNDNRNNDSTNQNEFPGTTGQASRENTQEQYSGFPQSPPYPPYHHAPRRRRNIPAIILVLILIVIGVLAASYHVGIAVGGRITGNLRNGTPIPDNGINFSQTGITLDISLARNTVVVETHNRNDFLVVFTPPARGSYVRPAYAFSQNGMRLDIVEESRFRLINIDTSNTRGILTVFIPQNLDGAFAGMDISSSSGGVEIHGDNGNRIASNVVLGASSGRVQAENFAANTIEARTSSGAVTLNGLAATTGDFTVRASSGGVRANNLTVAGNLDINTSSGSIRADTLDIGGELYARASSGGITAENFTAHSASLRASSGTLNINNGDVTAGDFIIRTSSGGIRVNGLDVNGNLQANASSGRFTADDVTVLGNLTAETSSGGMTLDNLRVDGQINGRASSGNITITGVVDENRVSLRTSSGRITVNGQRW